MTKLTLPSRAAATATAVLGACLAALACPLPALAAATAKGAGENTPLNFGSSSTSTHTSSGGASIVRTIVGLAIVIAVIWGLTWILRQVKAGRDPNVSSDGLASVAALQLGSGRSVHLVRAGSDYLLLGAAEHGVVPIFRYSEEEAEDAGLLPVDDEPQRPRRALLGPGDDSAAGGHDPMRMPSPNSTLIDRVREWTVRR